MVEGRGPNSDADFTGPGGGGRRDVRDRDVRQAAGGPQYYGKNTGATICSVGPAGIGVGAAPPIGWK